MAIIPRMSERALRMTPSVPAGERQFPYQGAPFAFKEVEESVIATVLVYPDLYYLVDFLTPEDFFFRANRVLWGIIATLHGERRPFSAKLVQALYNASPEAAAPLSDRLLDALLSRQDVDALQQNAYLLKDARDRRLLAGAFHEAVGALGRGEPPEAVLERVMEARERLTTWTEGIDLMDRVLADALNHLRGQSYLPTGIRELDEFLAGGLPKGTFVVLGGRPSTGKTSFARKVVRTVASLGGRVYWASYDQLPSAILLLEAARILEVPLDTLKRATREDEELLREVEGAIRQVAESWRGRVVLDGEEAPVEVLAYKVRKAHRNAPLDLVVVDYVQYLRTANERVRDIERVSKVSRVLKSLASGLGVTVLGLAQLSRGVEQREGQPPVLSDLRDSGQLEQDADIVCFIHRPALYSNNEDPQRVQILVRKQKLGPTGEVEVRWVPEMAEFA